MKLQEQYKRLFKGKPRSNDGVLLTENDDKIRLAKAYLPIVKANAKLKQLGLKKAEITSDNRLKMTFNKYLEDRDVLDDIIPIEVRWAGIGMDNDFDKDIYNIYIVFNLKNRPASAKSPLEDIDWDYNKEGKTISVGDTSDDGRGTMEAVGTVEINGVEYEWAWTKDTENVEDDDPDREEGASFSNVTIDPNGEAIDAMEVDDGLFDAIHTNVLAELGLE
tara:strand:- start:2449 stop:3108 length:660 start_codon:yes stop_codon:yes gene_type:complete